MHLYSAAMNFRYFFVLISFLIPYAKALSNVSLSISPSSVYNGQFVTFSCSANADQPITYWVFYKSTEELSSGPSNTYNISSVTPENASDYKCEAFVGANSAISQPKTLVVSTLSNVQLVFSSNPINEGQDVTLTCGATADPSISKWTFYKDGVEIQSESSVDTHTLSNVQTNGTFKCRATSNSGRTMESTLTNLTVEAIFTQPTITGISTSTVITGTTVVITCTAQNVKAGIIVKYKFLLNGSSVQEESDKNTYTIAPVQTSHAGEYTCEASFGNIKRTSGSNVLSVQLHVTLGTIDVSEGQDSQIKCVVSGNETVSSFEWTFDNIVVSETSGVFVKTNANTSESGKKVTCKAKKDAMESNTADAIFTVLTKLVVYLGDQRADEGQNATFLCFLRSKHVDPTFTWYVDGQKQAVKIDTFIILSVNRDLNQKSVTCQGESVDGVKSEISSAVLTVQWLDKPAVTGNFLRFEEQLLFLECTGSSNPQASYQWFKDGASIVNATSKTFTKTTNRSDSGNYSCNLTNVLGSKQSDQHVLKVPYLDAPTITILNGSPTPKENTNVTMKCDLTTYQLFGSPVTFTWTRNTETLSNTEVLNVVGIERAQSGVYECSVSAVPTYNRNNKASVDLTVYYKPENLFLSPSETEVVKRKDVNTLTINCQLDSLGSPTGKLSWIFNSNVLSSTTTDENLYLNLNPLLRNHTGFYTCEGKNSIGSVNKTIELTVLEKPDAPTNIRRIESTPVSLLIGWDIPFDGNSPITGYIVNINDTIELSENKTLNITNLGPDMKYTITVQAKNGEGDSVKSAAIVLNTLESAPSSPRNFKAVTGGEQKALTLSWLEPDPTNGVIIRYRICYTLQARDGKVQQNSPESCSNLEPPFTYNFQINNLDHYSNYSLQVSAMNKAGYGSPATANALTMEGEPDKVTNIVTDPKETNITIQWKKPDFFNGVFKNYVVERNNTELCRATSSTSCVIQNLKPYTEYNDIFIVAYNTRYNSRTRVDLVQTLAGAPPPFTDVLPPPPTDTVTTDSFQIKLVEFSAINGPVKVYQVIAKKLDGNQKPLKLPKYYTEKDVQNGVDGLFVVQEISESSQFGSTVTIKSSSTAKRKRRATSGGFTLDPDTYYAVFVRGFVGSGNFQTTGWYEPIKTDSDGFGIGVIAGIVVGIILALFVAAVLWYCFYHKRRENKDTGGVMVPIDKLPKKSLRVPTVDPLVPILQDRFEEHVMNLKANSNYGFSQEYSSINRELEYPYNCSRLQENNIKNRYHNVPAYDETRVMLNVLDGESHTDYINANYIDGFERNREYIASQGPLPETIFDFWRMTWESETTTIVMLTRLVEKGRVKCAQYWPESGSLALKDILITLTDVQDFPDHVVRTFHVTRTGQAVERNVKQFHYVAWPDFGVPADPSSLLGFIRKVNNWKGLSHGPGIIHCSAGVGRTGTYITIDSQIKSLKAKSEITIYQNVTLLRQQRCLMVQTEDQYVFIHNALIDYMEAGETEVEASDLREYIKKQSQVDSKTAMTSLMEEFIRLAKTDKKDRFTEANKSVNQSKNRYKNVYPYDDTRVKLSQKPAIDGSDYINANYIDSYAHKDYFIATQAPLESTVGDFWRMIWEQNCYTIVMLTREVEGQQVKTHMYWPQKGSPKIDHFIVEITTETTFGDYIVRDMKLTNTDASASRIVKQFQYTTWPDNGSPDTGVGIIELIGQVQKWNTSVNNKIITVHCTAGVGRTGVFMALTNLIERVKTEGVVDVYQTVKKMRQQRTAMVQTRDQYEFCYRALQEYLESFDLYANFN